MSTVKDDVFDEVAWPRSTLKIVGSCSSRGFDSTRSVMFTICRSVQRTQPSLNDAWSATDNKMHKDSVALSIWWQANGLSRRVGRGSSTARMLTLRAGD